MHDVQSVEITSFPVEELGQVNVDEDSVNQGRKAEAICLKVSNAKNEHQKRPCHHANPGVGPLWTAIDENYAFNFGL